MIRLTHSIELSDTYSLLLYREGSGAYYLASDETGSEAHRKELVCLISISPEERCTIVEGRMEEAHISRILRKRSGEWCLRVGRTAQRPTPLILETCQEKETNQSYNQSSNA